MKTCRRCIYFGKQGKTHYYICNNSKSECFKKLSPHGKIPKACKSYKGKPNPFVGGYVDYGNIDGMKFIESLRGNYPDSTFWIIGTDPNLDFYPDDFFDDKLNITLNFASIAFPDSNYFCLAHTVVARGIVDKLGPAYLNKCIFVPSAQKHRDSEKIIWWEDWGLNPIYAKSLKKPVDSQDDEDKIKMIEQLTTPGIFELIGGKGILNCALQCVALFGAKKIILVGCSNKGTATYYCAQKRGMAEFDQKRKMKPVNFQQYRTGQSRNIISKKKETTMIIGLLREQKIEIVKHKFNEEKGKFVFEEMRLDG